jgi:hypothetical protein
MNETYEHAKDLLALVGLLCVGATALVLLYAVIAYFRSE